MPKGQHFYYRLKDTVVDGTACNPDTLDVCVEGVCQVSSHGNSGGILEGGQVGVRERKGRDNISIIN